MPVWYALLDGPNVDVDLVRRHFAQSNFDFKEIDEKWALSAPAFEQCNSKEEVTADATSLIACINTAMRLSSSNYTGLELHGLAEIRGGRINRTFFMKSGLVAMSAVGAVVVAGAVGAPVRSREERLVTLLARSREIEDIAESLAVRPVTWPAMRQAYETAKGLMSPTGDRADYQTLIDLGWMTAPEARALYNTATHYSHGHPRDPIRGGNAMAHEDAVKLVDRLFWKLVDAKEPV